MSSDANVEITQEDRDAAAAIHTHYNPKSKQTQMQAARMRSGTFDHDPLVQAFARHRTTSLAAQEPEAMRYDFDGYGWKYIDSGSGSDWQTRHPNAEPLYASLAAQDGLVDALRKVRDCALISENTFADRPPSVSWIVSQLTKLLPEIDAALASIEVKSDQPMSTRLHPDNPFGNGGWE